MSLSDKIVMAEDHYYEGIGWCVRTEDVKEFIKELKDKFKNEHCAKEYFEEIDKLAGEKLQGGIE